MSDRKLIPLRDPSQIPPDMTEEQARKFWETHEITEQYLDRAGAIPDRALPTESDGTRTILLRVDVGTLRRVKTLAGKKRTSPRALLMEGLAEWLSAAEEREDSPSSG